MLDAAISEGARIVCAIGGDGTVNEIGKRLIGRDAALGVVPTGSGNGLARHLHISMKVERALEQVLSGHELRIDTALANGVPFLGVAGLGFDAVVAHRFAEAGSRGLQTYVKQGIKAFINYQDESYRFTVDGSGFEEKAFLVAVGNSSQYGNDARIAPLASLQDGRFDLCIVRRPSFLAVPMMLRQLFNGQLHLSKHVTTIRCSSVVVERATSGVGHVDGEPTTFDPRISFMMNEASLRVIAGVDRC